MKHKPIPDDYEVRPLHDDEAAKDRATCGHCGLSWDDGIVTSMTPAPSARCPFEAFHVYDEDAQTLREQPTFIKAPGLLSYEVEQVIAYLRLPRTQRRAVIEDLRRKREASGSIIYVMEFLETV